MVRKEETEIFLMHNNERFTFVRKNNQENHHGKRGMPAS